MGAIQNITLLPTVITSQNSLLFIGEQNLIAS